MGTSMFILHNAQTISFNILSNNVNLYSFLIVNANINHSGNLIEM